jgi:hypothetical protein
LKWDSNGSCELRVAILDASIRLYEAHCRIDRSSSSTAFPVIYKLPVARASESRCGTSCSIETPKDRTKRVAELSFTCKPATFSSALGRTRTCDLLIRRPNRAVLCGSLKCAKGDS